LVKSAVVVIEGMFVIVAQLKSFQGGCKVFIIVELRIFFTLAFSIPFYISNVKCYHGRKLREVLSEGRVRIRTAGHAGKKVSIAGELH
jgi:hypothetical protein